MRVSSNQEDGEWDEAEAQAIRAELESICAGTAFRTSKRSCEFLRHVVERQLEGSSDALKERSIGVELLGRNSSYDTSSDAAVRVRANEVRRRLQAHYQENKPVDSYRIDLPIGTYSPHFERLRSTAEAEPLDATSIKSQAIVVSATQTEEVSVLTLSGISLIHRSLPILIALFLCAFCLRVQFNANERFDTFWARLTESKNLLIEFPEHNSDTLSPSERLRLLAPILTTAGRFNITTHVATSHEAIEMLNDSVVLTIVQRNPAENSSSQRKSGTSDEFWGSFTVVPGQPIRLEVAGSEYAALQAVIAHLTNVDLFPHDLGRSDINTPHSLVLSRTGSDTPTAVRVITGRY